MSGSNTICTVTALLETGIVPMVEPVTQLTLEAPGGLIRVKANCADGKCESVTFRNVPCFVFGLDRMIEVEGLGSVKVDVAYGGMIYVLVDARALGFAIVAIDPSEARELVTVGERIKAAAAQGSCRPFIRKMPRSTPSTRHCLPDRSRRCRIGRKTARNTVIEPSRLRRASCIAAVVERKPRNRVDERLILASLGTRGDRERLAMRLSLERRRAHIRHPDLDRSETLLAQAPTMFVHPFAGALGLECGHDFASYCYMKHSRVRAKRQGACDTESG